MRSALAVVSAPEVRVQGVLGHPAQSASPDVEHGSYLTASLLHSFITAFAPQSEPQFAAFSYRGHSNVL